MSCHCGALMTGIHLEGPTVATAFCASGHRIYLFKRDNGEWESLKERQARMALVRVCEDCGSEFHVPSKIYYGTRPALFCHKCRAKRVRAGWKKQHEKTYQPKKRDRSALWVFRQFAVRITAKDQYQIKQG